MQEEIIDKELNKREKYKARRKPYDYYLQEFETVDFDSLGEGDRYYLQDYGIFNTDFLEDEFTIRLRNANGGHFSASDFLFLAQIIQEYELTLVITARSGFQLHEVYADNVKEIWHKLNDNRLTTWQSFGDNIRNIVTDVYDGVGQYAHIESFPIIKQMNEYILENPKYVGMLPRRVSIGISGNSANVSSFFANDLYFALAKKEGVYGFNLYMGGKNTQVAQDADIFLLKEDVFPFFKAFVSTFYTYGSRFSRSKTRLVYLIEDIGMQKLKMLIEQEFGKEFQSAGESAYQNIHFEEFEELKDGSYSYTYQTNFGKISADELLQLGKFAEENTLQIRVGIDQNIYLLGLKNKKVPFTPASLSSTVVACAGNLCPYAVWSIKDETAYLPLKKIQKNHIKVGFSGCAKGCARHRHTDIGLIGLKTNNFGATDGGARVFIGAQHSRGESISRELFSMVPFVHLHQTLSLIITLFEQSDYTNFQNYSKEILEKFSEEFLALWYLYNFKNSTYLAFIQADKKLSHEEEIALLTHTFKDLTLDVKSFKKSANALAKELWRVEGVDPTYKPPIKRVNFR